MDLRLARVTDLDAEKAGRQDMINFLQARGGKDYARVIEYLQDPKAGNYRMTALQAFRKHFVQDLPNDSDLFREENSSLLESRIKMAWIDAEERDKTEQFVRAASKPNLADTVADILDAKLVSVTGDDVIGRRNLEIIRDAVQQLRVDENAVPLKGSVPDVISLVKQPAFKSEITTVERGGDVTRYETAVDPESGLKILQCKQFGIGDSLVKEETVVQSVDALMGKTILVHLRGGGKIKHKFLSQEKMNEKFAWLSKRADSRVLHVFFTSDVLNFIEFGIKEGTAGKQDTLWCHPFYQGSDLGLMQVIRVRRQKERNKYSVKVNLKEGKEQWDVTVAPQQEALWQRLCTQGLKKGIRSYREPDIVSFDVSTRCTFEYDNGKLYFTSQRTLPTKTVVKDVTHVGQDYTVIFPKESGINNYTLSITDERAQQKIERMVGKIRPGAFTIDSGSDTEGDEDAVNPADYSSDDDRQTFRLQLRFV